MEEKNIQQKIQFITCPNCEGSGRGKLGLSCSNCAGMGLGTFPPAIVGAGFGSRFFYWGTKLSLTVIRLNHLKKLIDKIVNFVAYIIALFGIISLGLWYWLNSSDLKIAEDFFFWKKKSSLILIFLVGVLAWMFIIYRVSEKKRKSHKIQKLKYSERKKNIKIPNTWVGLKKIKYKIDVAGGMSEDAFEIIEDAFSFGRSLGHAQVEPIHLFYALLADKRASAMFSRLDINMALLLDKIKNQLNRIPEAGAREQKNIFAVTAFSVNVKEILISAYIRAMQNGQEKVETEQFIIPILNRDSNLTEILYDMEITHDKITNTLEWFRINDEMVKDYGIYRKMARFKPNSNMDRAYTSVATPILDHFSYDLTRAAKWGRLPMCVNREKEVQNIFESMESGSGGIILVGPFGVGKSAIINGVARLMVKEDVPKMLKDKRLLELDASRLISGASPEKAQERLLVMIDEINRAGNIILYIDNIENIVGITAGEEQSLELSEVLVGALERKEIICLASATSENYAKYIEGRSLGEAMAKVDIKEPKGNQAIQIIESKVGFFEAKHKVYFSYNAIERVVLMSDKYIHDKYLPDKAVDILEKIAVKIAKTKGENSLITEEDVSLVISEITGIPATKISESESKSLLNLEDRIHSRMVDQEEAVGMVSASLRRARTEFRDVKRPIANFLFLGPTGVGKTELAKTVSEIYFGDEKYMIRLDMSEYQHPDSIKKMIGDESGIKGYLTEAVRKAPFSLILLDEFEKAHADILNLFLQVMDDGRLTDGEGRTIDFTNSIIIATSNAGALYIQEEVIKGTAIEKIKEVLINEHLNKTMRPELVNRFDGVIVFKPLSEDDVRAIARFALNKTAKMLKEKGMELRVEEKGVFELARLGFDPKFGARPLKRVVQEKINNVVANKILEGGLKRRDTVVIDANANIQIEKGREL